MKKELLGKGGGALGQSYLNQARYGTRLALVALLLFATAYRLPAPIVEEPEKPAATADQPSKPKWKRSAKTRTISSENQSTKVPAPSGPARFAGNWTGTISQGLWGNVKVPLTINADGSSVKMTAGERPATVNGNTITWKSGMFNEITWTLSPQKDGATALVTSKSGLGVNGTATFSRTQSLVVSAPPNKPAATNVSTHPVDLPTARQVPEKPGYVYSPFDPTNKLILDVRDKAHGATVKDPSGRLFVVP